MGAAAVWSVEGATVRLPPVVTFSLLKYSIDEAQTASFT